MNEKKPSAPGVVPHPRSGSKRKHKAGIGKLKLAETVRAEPFNPTLYKSSSLSKIYGNRGFYEGALIYKPQSATKNGVSQTATTSPKYFM